MPAGAAAVLGVAGTALLLDRALGEFPARAHPVVWMGSIASRALRAAPDRGPLRQLAFGVLLALGIPGLFALASAIFLRTLEDFAWIQFAASVLLLKSAFAMRALGEAGAGVADALRAGDLAAARLALRSLCSRDAAGLDGPAVAAAAVESVAENASDSIVAPLFWFAVCGVPGAVAYRAVNTLDAMIGYRGRTEYLGKPAARLDDLLNLIPARLTAALLLAAGWVAGRDARRALRVWWRDRGRTASPNAGHPMAAMAGLLGVELEKAGHYRLGDPGLPVSAATIDAAWRVVEIAVLLGLGLVAAAVGGARVAS